jgi:uncharacterized protein (TIGR03083 family)
MDIPTLLEHLESDGRRLVEAAASAGWEAPVPGLEWDVRTVVAHTSCVHRWATAVVTLRPDDEVDAARRSIEQAPGDALLGEWFTDGLTELVAALRAAPDDLDVFTFLRAPSPRHFWARRQAHETAIHRSDVEAALGAVTACDVDFSQDGIAELVAEMGTQRRHAVARPGVLALAPTDGGDPWRLTFGGERNRAEIAPPGGADAVVGGASCELYRWLWNRPADVTISGDLAIARSWASAVQVTW